MWKNRYDVLERITRKLSSSAQLSGAKLEKSSENISVRNAGMHTVNIQVTNHSECGEYIVSVTRKYVLRAGEEVSWNYKDHRRVPDGEEMLDMLVYQIEELNKKSLEDLYYQKKKGDELDLEKQIMMITRERDSLRTLMHALKSLLDGIK